jgi:hypothetical protein
MQVRTWYSAIRTNDMKSNQMNNATWRYLGRGLICRQQHQGGNGLAFLRTRVVIRTGRSCEGCSFEAQGFCATSLGGGPKPIREVPGVETHGVPR